MAFQRGDTVPVVAGDGTVTREPTADALLGAIMHSEFQSATVQQVELLGAWAKNWHKAHSR